MTTMMSMSSSPIWICCEKLAAMSVTAMKKKPTSASRFTRVMCATKLWWKAFSKMTSPIGWCTWPLVPVCDLPLLILLSTFTPTFKELLVSLNWPSNTRSSTLSTHLLHPSTEDPSLPCLMNMKMLISPFRLMLRRSALRNCKVCTTTPGFNCPRRRFVSSLFMGHAVAPIWHPSSSLIGPPAESPFSNLETDPPAVITPTLKILFPVSWAPSIDPTTNRIGRSTWARVAAQPCPNLSRSCQNTSEKNRKLPFCPISLVTSPTLVPMFREPTIG
mmetsp:Transcript_30196/g.63104  ORF Transcript_30196/g.63104 Transcript_30196/m.63104 type:complete len:274 (+) Transcript_30196:365-1186(+)